MAARQGLSQKKTQAGSLDMFWKLKQRLRTEQEEQAYGLRTQSISSCNLNYTELFLPLIITSLLQQESKRALLKTASDFKQDTGRLEDQGPGLGAATSRKEARNPVTSKEDSNMEEFS